MFRNHERHECSKDEHEDTCTDVECLMLNVSRLYYSLPSHPFGEGGLLFLFNVSLAPHVAPKAVGVVGNVDETKGNGRCEERFILAPAYGLLVPKTRDDAEERRSKA